MKGYPVFRLAKLLLASANFLFAWFSLRQLGILNFKQVQCSNGPPVLRLASQKSQK